MEVVSSASDPTALIGLVVPVIMSVVIQKSWSTSLQSVVALVVCLAATLSVNAYMGDPLGSSIGAVIMTTFVSYKAFWEPTGIADKIEESTYLSDEDE